jgi:NADH:ubiquinone oxidoreductase subunit C
MNRKERRAMEKKLGIAAYRKTLPLNKRFEIIRENIIEGKKTQVKKKEDVRVEQNKTEITDLNKKIADRAIQLMLGPNGIDYYSATEKAKEEFGQL